MLDTTRNWKYPDIRKNVCGKSDTDKQYSTDRNVCSCYELQLIILYLIIRNISNKALECTDNLFSVPEKFGLCNMDCNIPIFHLAHETSSNFLSM